MSHRWMSRAEIFNNNIFSVSFTYLLQITDHNLQLADKAKVKFYAIEAEYLHEAGRNIVHIFSRFCNPFRMSVDRLIASEGT